MKGVRIKFPSHASRKPNLRFGEKRMHATEQRTQLSYFNMLIELISQYKEVIIFGSGIVTNELFNLLHKHHTLRAVNVNTAHTARLTPRQMVAFVRKYFVEAKLLV